MPVRQADVRWLADRSAAEWDHVDFGWLWGARLAEWAIPCMNAIVWWTEDGHRAGYTVNRPGRDTSALVLAADPVLAREVITTLKPKNLSHHPSGGLVQNALDQKWATAEAKPSQAAMACELQEGVLQPYLEALESGKRLPGFTLFPLPFLAC